MTSIPRGGSVASGPTIEVEGVVKEYGERRVLDGVDLVVEPGSVFGFLGPNGSGKTTLIRILLGLSRPTDGAVRILGAAPGSTQARARIGYCPDVPGFPAWMTAREVLEQAASLFRLDPNTTRRRIPELLDLTGLRDSRDRVGGYSRGMRQRLGLAQALINAPALLIFDEPTSALDPMGRRTVLELVAELKGKTTVFFSTHLLPDVERVCDDVAVLRAGSVVANGSVNDLRQQFSALRGHVVIEVDDRDRLRRELQAEPWVVDVSADPYEPDALAVQVDDLRSGAARVAALVASRGGDLYRLEPRSASLEDVVVELMGAER